MGPGTREDLETGDFHAESKTVCGSNECEDRVDEFEVKVACRVNDVASSVTKDS